MSRQFFNDGQEVLDGDLSNISPSIERTFLDSLLNKMLGGQTNKIFGASSFAVTRVDADTVAVAAGVGLQYDAAQVTPEPTQRLLLREASSNHDIEAADVTNPRIDLVCIKAALDTETTASRNVKSLIDSSISSTSLVIRKKWDAEILIVEGTPDALPSAPATPAGYIKIAEIYVDATTGITSAANITDFRSFFKFGIYDAVVGSSDYATHATLSSAVDYVGANGKILVEANETVNSATTISDNNIQIDFLPQVTFTKGSATQALILDADGIKINGGRFLDFDGGSDVAITVQAGADYAQLMGQRFNNCDTDISDLSGTATILGNITE